MGRKFILREAYDHSFSIANYDGDQTSGFDHILLHDAENYCPTTPLYASIELFGDREVHKYYGLDYAEFMELPRDVCTKILDHCLVLTKRKAETSANFLNDEET